MRLIDADALLYDVRSHCESYFADDFAREWVDKQPTVEAVPVKHGRWTVTPIYIKCSECGESFMLYPQNYCPNCGADMRGDNSENEDR